MSETVVSPLSVSFGNSKLGQVIGAWSIPAGKLNTCPGETETCRMSCYVKRGFFNMPSNVAALNRNKMAADSPSFASWMIHKLRNMAVPVVRIHVSGDFYSLDYLRKWETIVTSLPDVRFFAYTRSWREEELLLSLIRLSMLSNMELWWSLDRDAIDAPFVASVRRAYMAVDDSDAEKAPAGCDLIFRVRRSTTLKRVNGVTVCPAESGVLKSNKVTCATCKLCWRPRPAKWLGYIASDSSAAVDYLEITNH